MSRQIRTHLFLLLAAWSAHASAQAIPASCTATMDIINFSVETRSVYPGFFPGHVPRVYVRVKLETYADGPAPHLFDLGWWQNSSNYIVLVNGVQEKHFEPNWDTQGLSVFLDPTVDLRAGDTISLFAIIPRMTAGQPTMCAQGHSGALTAVPVPATSNYAATVEPSWIPKQELNNGTKRDVGHLDIKLDFPTIKTARYARLYARGNQVLSTDGKDKATKLEGVLGTAGRFAGGWLIPWEAEVQVKSDQRVDNASTVISGGTAFIVPWAWSRGVLWNGVVRAPFSPQFSFAAQQERRMKQDAESQKRFKDKNAFRLYGDVTWSPIHLLTGSGYHQDDISVEFVAKAWYLPNQLNAAGRRFDRLEGVVEASALFPLRKFNIVGGLSPSGATAAKQRIRLKYTHGANDAAGFKHYSQLTIGLEVIK